MKSILLGSTFALLAFPAVAQTAPVLLDEVVLPTGLSLGGVQFGGISDLTWDAQAGRFLAISDDRVEYGPARFYEIGLTIGEGQVAGLDIAAMHELKAPGDAAFPVKGADPEGIALASDGRLFWSSERDANGVPAIFVSDRNGGGTQQLDLPPAYLPGADGAHGVQTNLGFEGLDLSTDGTRLFALSENGLAQDGGKATLEAGSPSRMLVIDTKTLKPVAEYLYPTDAIPVAPEPADGWADNGASALAMLPDGTMIVSERNFSDGHGFNIRFFVVDIAGATDIGEQDMMDKAARPVAKTPWFSLKDGDFGLTIDNIESIAFGPAIEGKPSMLLASDNNFSDEQATKFTLFTVDLPALATQ